MTEENRHTDPIFKKYVKLYGDNRFSIEICTNKYEIGIQGYRSHSNMADSIFKIEPEILHEELSLFKAGIITDVKPLTYDIHKDRWSYTIYGYGSYNGKLTTREIIRNYYLKGPNKNVGEN